MTSTPPAAVTPPPLPVVKPVTREQPARSSDPDEINLLEYAYVLVKHKRSILGAAALGLILGLAFAYVKGPQFEASVLIAPRESDSQKTPNLSSLGAFGGLVASQLSFGTTPGLDRIETILSTRQFGAELVTRYNLLPQLYKTFWRKAYSRWYDESSKQWKPGFRPPVMSGVGQFLAAKVIKRQIGKNSKTMTIGLTTRDSVLSYQLLSACVEYLNIYIRDNIQDEAQSNVHYLDSSLGVVADPLLREKVQALIATEIEKMMVVSKEAFQVVDPVVVSRDFRHSVSYPLGLGLGLCLLAMAAAVIGHALGAGVRSATDKGYIEAMKRELTSV